MKGGAFALVSLFLSVSLLPATPPVRSSARAQITALLDGQVQAWNKGDLTAFVKGYRQSDQTEYVGANGIVQGWKAIHERYQRTYQHGKSMGRLAQTSLSDVCEHGCSILIG